MKRLLLIIATGLFFSSCKKELPMMNGDPPPSLAKSTTWAAKSNKTVTETTTFFNDSLYSCSAGEWIQFTGDVTLTITEQVKGQKYFSSYSSDFSKVTGIGNTTGNIYNGGGVLFGSVTTAIDPENPAVDVRTREHLYFRSSAGAWYEFYVVSHYKVNSQGQVVLNYIIDKSKNCNENQSQP